MPTRIFLPFSLSPLHNVANKFPMRPMWERILVCANYRMTGRRKRSGFTASFFLFLYSYFKNIWDTSLLLCTSYLSSEGKFVVSRFFSPSHLSSVSNFFPNLYPIQVCPILPNTSPRHSASLGCRYRRRPSVSCVEVRSKYIAIVDSLIVLNIRFVRDLS